MRQSPEAVHSLCLVELEQVFAETQAVIFADGEVPLSNLEAVIALTEACAISGDNQPLLSELRSFWFTTDKEKLGDAFVEAAWTLGKCGDKAAFDRLKAHLEESRQTRQQAEFAGGPAFMGERMEQSTDLNTLIWLCKRDGIDPSLWVETFSPTPEQAALSMLGYYEASFSDAKTPQERAMMREQFETTARASFLANGTQPAFTEVMALATLIYATDADTRDIAALCFLEAQTRSAERDDIQLKNISVIGARIMSDERMAEEYGATFAALIDHYTMRVIDSGGDAHRVCASRLEWDSLLDRRSGIAAAQVIEQLDKRAEVMDGHYRRDHLPTHQGPGVPVRDLSGGQAGSAAIKDEVLTSLSLAAAAAGEVEEALEYINNMAYDCIAVDATQQILEIADEATLAALCETVVETKRVSALIVDELAFENAVRERDVPALKSSIEAATGAVERFIAKNAAIAIGDAVQGPNTSYDAFNDDDLESEPWYLTRLNERAERGLRIIKEVAPEEYLGLVEHYMCVMDIVGTVHGTIEWSGELMDGGYTHEADRAYEHAVSEEKEKPVDRRRSIIALSHMLTRYLDARDQFAFEE